jgi:hypothetical protein
MYRVLDVDEIKKLIAQFVVLCETNISSLINKKLDNFYHIKTKLLQYAFIMHCSNPVPRIRHLNEAWDWERPTMAAAIAEAQQGDDGSRFGTTISASPTRRRLPSSKPVT